MTGERPVAAPWAYDVSVELVGQILDHVHATAVGGLTEEQHRLLDLSLGVLDDDPALACVNVPIAVAEYAGGSADDGIAAAAAASCVYLGADLLDNVVDAEPRGRFADVDTGAAVVAAATLLASTAYRCVLSHHHGPALVEVLSRRLAQMAGGQIADLALDRPGTSLAGARTAVELKAGAEFALFAELGAISSRAPAEAVEHIATFAQRVGVGYQLGSDVQNISRGAASSDLARGLHTTPVVAARSRMPAAEQRRLDELLRAGRNDPDARDEAWHLVARAGGVHFTALRIEGELYAARQALRSVERGGPAYENLLAWCDEASLFKRNHPE